MKFNFDEIYDRRGKEAKSYDSVGKTGYPSKAKDGFDTIPMFAADMDFAIAPSITTSIEERLKHPIFGYYDMPERFYTTIIDWHKRTKGVNDLKASYIGYENDVLGGIVSSLKALNEEGDYILMHEPTFVGFIDIINQLGYKAITSALIKDSDDVYRMNIQDMEDKIIKYNIKTLILCSPHNPMGRVWEYTELEEMSSILEKHNVKVISDEIWSEILIDGNHHTPIQEASEYLKYNSISLYSPNKGFNIAGLNISYHIIYDEDLESRVSKIGNETYYNMANILSLHALYGAYSQEGLEWLSELNEYIESNIDYVEKFIKQNFDDIKIVRPQGTYIIFMDFEEYLKNKSISMDDLIQKGYDYGIGWTDARPYKADFGIKLNLALPLSKVKTAMDRLKEYVL